MNRLGLFLMAAIALAGWSGCNDPYSRRRIEQRTRHANETIVDLSRREGDGVGRIRQADQTLRAWWRTDNERWRRKAPTIGDYVW